jgi:transposase
LEVKLDLDFVRGWTRELHAERGRPSIAPVKFFKLQLIMFFEGIRPERQLIATASLNLSHCWYLGYALDESLPDHSSLARIRQRLDITTFERFFQKIVDLCWEAGLIWGRELYVDATKVLANAGVPSLGPRFYYEAKVRVADLFADGSGAEGTPRTETETEATASTGTVWLLMEWRSNELSAVGERPWQLLEERWLDPTRFSVGSYRRTIAIRVSATAPDATPRGLQAIVQRVANARCGTAEGRQDGNGQRLSPFRGTAWCNGSQNWFQNVRFSAR